MSGLGALNNVSALAYLFGGSIFGMVLGVIPGLGGIVVLSIALSLLYHIPLTGCLCLFLGVQAASYFSASITSILLNTPSHPEAFAVAFDGFPMAQRGEAGRALGISAASTCVGGVVGCVVLIGFIQIINTLPLIFHPPEYVALITLAMLLVGTLGTDAASKALISASLGLVVSTIGASPITGVFRFTLNATSLYGGISLVSLALGAFAIPQMVLIFGSATTVARQDMLGKEVSNVEVVSLEKGFGKQVVRGVFETFEHWVALIRASLIGVICGVIPGIGGFAANFLSYGVAEQMSNHRELFGTGIPEGIIAPEGSSLAKEAGGMVPVMGLGIPGGIGSALLLAALELKGIKVGFGFSKSYPVLPYEMMWIIGLAGIIGTVTGVLAAPLLAKITRVKGPILVPLIFALSAAGSFIATTSFFAVVEVFVFGVIGLALRRLRYSLASFVIGLVLGPTLEDNIYLTHNVFHGFTFLERPFTDVLFVIGIACLILKTLQFRRVSARALAEIEADESLSDIEKVLAQQQRERAQHPHPLLGALVTICLVIFATVYTIYGRAHYTLDTALMPEIVGGIIVLASIWRLPFEMRAYVRYRRNKGSAKQSPMPEGSTANVAYAPARHEDGDTENAVPTLGLSTVLLAPASTSQTVREEVLPPIRDRSWGFYGSYTREIVAFAWFGILLLLCWSIGFSYGVGIFCVLYGLTSMRRVFESWIRRIIFAVLSGVIMGLVTYEMLNLTHLTFTAAFHL